MNRKGSECLRIIKREMAAGPRGLIRRVRWNHQEESDLPRPPRGGRETHQQGAFSNMEPVPVKSPAPDFQRRLGSAKATETFGLI